MNYFHYSQDYKIYPFKNTISFTDYIIKKSQNDADFHILPGLTTEELNVRAFLTVIRQIENNGGTPLGYNAQFGGGVFTTYTYDEKPEDYFKHPEDPIDAWSTTSSAAGAYQFLFDLWPKNLEFSPVNQDQEAIEKLKFRKVYTDILAGKITKVKNSSFFQNEWTSFKSTKLRNQVEHLFAKNIIKELNNNSVIYTPYGKLLPE